MKELVALVFLIVLIGFGWNQSYKDQLDSLLGNPPPAPVTPPPAPAAPPTPGATALAPATPAATPTREAEWLWNKGTLDTQKNDGVKPGGVKRAR